MFASGTFWKTQRRFTQTSLQELGFGKSCFEEKIQKEAKAFVGLLKENKGEPLDIQYAIHTSIANVILSILCGKHHEYEDEWLKRCLDQLDISTKILMRSSVLANFLPFLRYLPGDLLQIKLLEYHKNFFKDYVQTVYKERLQPHNKNHVSDFMDAYVAEIKRRQELGERSDFTFEQLSYVMLDLFGAGTGTTSTAFRWALLYLLHYPELKQRLQAEIDRVVPDGSMPSLEDKEKL